MALVKCPECGKEISDKAQVCPGCGNPMKQRTEEETIHCPKCGSAQLEMFQKGFSGGKALVGAVAVGSLGLLAGTHGSKDMYLGCKSCGNKFKPKEAIHKVGGKRKYKAGEIQPLSPKNEVLVIEAIQSGDIERAIDIYEKSTNNVRIISAKEVKSLADRKGIKYNKESMDDSIRGSYTSCFVTGGIFFIVAILILLMIIAK